MYQQGELQNKIYVTRPASKSRLLIVQPLRLQPVLKGLPGDADRLECSGVGELIGRGAADTENGCDVIHGVCPALGHPFFVGAHKMILPANSILKWPLEALCHKGFLLIPC